MQHAWEFVCNGWIYGKKIGTWISAAFAHKSIVPMPRIAGRSKIIKTLQRYRQLKESTPSIKRCATAGSRPFLAIQRAVSANY
jgi:hypothetical protein